MSASSIELSEFADHFAGELFLPGTEGYDVGRAGFDADADQRPAVVATCAELADIREAVLMANALDLPVGVKATGHGVVAPANDAVLVDTSRLTGVSIDPERRVARVRAGALGGQVVVAAAAHGLAPLAGTAATVGTVSYVLGGGLGHLGRRFGWAADHVRSVELVAADGRLVRVDEEHEPDLFWAVRGAGRNFGVATEIELGLFPIAELYGGGLYFPGERAAEVFDAFVASIAEAPDELSLSVLLVKYPPLPVLPPELRGAYACHVRVAHCGDPAAIAGILGRFRAVGPTLLDTIRTLPFAEVASISGDPSQPAPASTKGTVLDRVDDGFVGALLDGVSAETPYVIEVRHLRGALSREPEPGNAVGQRGALLNVFTSAYPPFFPALEEQRARHQAVAAYGSGAALPNWLGGPHITTADVERAYGEPIWSRLRSLKAVWDPDNVFRFNQNIPPA